MLNKRNFTVVAWPALMLFLVVFIPHCISDYSSFMQFHVIQIISYIIAAIITEVFAYITCWAFVLRKAKGHRAIWINYIIWAFVSLSPYFA